VGVEVNGAANLLSAVHTWNGGGTGISLGTSASAYGAHQNRLVGCYLDYNTLDMWDPSDTLVESTFFLETHARLRAFHGAVTGLIMRFNTYSTSESVVLDGEFKSASGVRISDETNAAKSTRAQRALTAEGATRFAFDFSTALLFPSIPLEDIRYTFVEARSRAGAPPTFVQHVAHAPNSTAVIVDMSQPVSGTIFMEAAQAI